MIRSLALSLSLSLIACSGGGSPDPEPVVLRTYTVADGTAPELVSLIRRLFSARPGDAGEATATVASAAEDPRGRLVVVAPPALQRGIADLVDAMPPDRAEAGSLAMEYWFFEAKPADAHSHPPGHDTLADVFAAVEAVDGPQAWTLTARRRLVALASERSELISEGIIIEQVLAWRADRQAILADVQVEQRRVGTTRSRVEIQPDQTLVLAEVDDAAGSTRYTLLRASTAP